MNYKISGIPQRTEKPRSTGITMVMDKGLSVRQAEDFVSVGADYTDLVKIGFGTSFVTPMLKEKLAVYREAGINYYFGGTLFEAFLIRGEVDNYLKLIEEFKLEHIEISDGSMDIEHDEKCELIQKFSKYCTVLTEIGSKDPDILIPPYKWIELINKEKEAGAWKIIAEARESGTAGIFRKTGEVRSGLIDEILHSVNGDDLLWEAPQKSQQVWFIKLVGHNVNLGNIAPTEIIPLETLRIGLRGDTFTQFLDLKGE